MEAKLSCLSCCTQSETLLGHSSNMVSCLTGGQQSIEEEATSLSR